MPIAEIVNLRPTSDRYFKFKACNQPCSDQCGACFICRRACPPDCENGIEDGTGHVWMLRDRLPGFLIADVIDIFQNRDVHLTSREGIEFIWSVGTELFKETYPNLDAETLKRTLDFEALAQIVARFLSRLAPTGTTPPTPANVTPIATRKPRRSSPN